VTLMRRCGRAYRCYRCLRGSTDQQNSQTDGDPLSIPKEAVARSPSNSGRSRCQTARCRDGIDRHAKTRAQKHTSSKSVVVFERVVRTMRSLLPLGGGHGLRRLVWSVSQALAWPLTRSSLRIFRLDAGEVPHRPRAQPLARSLRRPGGDDCGG
jgi:hypothetical protein